MTEGTNVAMGGEPSPAAAGAGSPAPLAVEATGITKAFPGVLANDHVSFEAARGEIHALLGENGAGKTTFCNILMGLYRPDEGELRIDGRQVRFHSPRDAHEAGVFMVHQHFRLVESMSVAENVVLGWDRGPRWRFSPRRVEEEVAEVAERYRVPVDPTARVWQLSLGEQQRVEILKALFRGARILVLDEPTAVLTPQEVEQLFDSVRHLAGGGGTVVFVSHKLPEVMAVSHRVTVLRGGRSVGSVATADTDPRALARMMVGREVFLSRKAPAEAPEEGREPILDLAGVSVTGDRGTQALRQVSLTVRAGEILGVAGVAGNGQRELAEVVAGLRHCSEGKVLVKGRSLAPDPRGAIRAGVAYVPEDRMTTGVAAGLPIADNSILKAYRRRPYARGPIILGRAVASHAAELMRRFDVRAPGPRTLLRQLSGGNAQKVVLARELDHDPAVLVAASPTHGLDVGATESVRTLLVAAARRGVGVLLISEDLDELLDLADRVAVLYEGRIVGVVDAADFDVERIGLMMAGAGA